MSEHVILIREMTSSFFCIVACVFAVAGTAGLFRFRNTYARLHASSLAGTTATFSVFIAAVIGSPDLAHASRVVLIILFFLISAPTTTHIIARFAWKAGLDPRSSPKTEV